MWTRVSRLILSLRRRRRQRLAAAAECTGKRDAYGGIERHRMRAVCAAAVRQSALVAALLAPSFQTSQGELEGAFCGRAVKVQGLPGRALLVGSDGAGAYY
ncbi:hypothetical protein PLESTB_000668500 [Pleodorina starrii]|uniref:Uncharacterized protein n=1 Tax=Pleodorina starrii TaxID=330485 RepID=A0A9W6BIU2_9CHLO|nr:hypothetical protein PLESTB_000668500 [Pleodorina starrii]